MLQRQLFGFDFCSRQYLCSSFQDSCILLSFCCTFVGRPELRKKKELEESSTSTSISPPLAKWPTNESMNACWKLKAMNLYCQKVSKIKVLQPTVALWADTQHALEALLHSFQNVSCKFERSGKCWGQRTAKIIDQAYWNLLCKMKKYAPRSPRTWSFENIPVVSGLFLTICVAMCDLYLDLSFVPLISVSRQWSLWYPVRPEKSGWSNARQFFYGMNTGDSRHFLFPAGRTGKRNMPLVMSKRLAANWRPSRPEKLEITGTKNMLVTCDYEPARVPPNPLLSTLQCEVIEAINTFLEKKKEKDVIVATGVGNHQMMSCQFIRWTKLDAEMIWSHNEHQKHQKTDHLCEFLWKVEIKASDLHYKRQLGSDGSRFAFCHRCPGNVFLLADFFL